MADPREGVNSAMPPAGSRDRAPVGGSAGAKTPEAECFSVVEDP